MILPHDRSIAAWLADGPDQGPPEALARALAATRRTPRRPRWSFPERWLPMQMTMARTPSSRPLLILVVLAILAMAGAAAALYAGSRPAPLPAPFGPARNGVLVYADAGDVYLMDTPDGARRTLVGGPGKDTSPQFSRQGDRIAFLRADPAGGSRIMTVRPDGTDLRSISGPFPSIHDIRWSPDASRLLVAYDERGFDHLAIVDADGSGARELDVGTTADLASWRPDGSAIVFRGQPGDGSQADAVYLVDPAAANVRRLAIPGSKAPAYDFEGLAWSPDGSRLSFMRQADLGGFLGWQIGIADVDDAGNVTDVRSLKLDTESAGELLPIWSPDGSQLAFIVQKHGERRIAVAAADGTVPARAVGPAVPAASGMDKAWSPDGRTLIVTEIPRTGPQPFWSVDVATGIATEIGGPTTDLPTWQRLAP